MQLDVKEDRWIFFLEFGLLHPNIGGKDFLLYLVPIRTVMFWGGVIFTVLMMEGHEFYMLMNLGKLGSVSPPCWT